MNAQKNWAENFTYSANRIHTPRTVDEVRAIVKQSAKVHALGTRHSFNHIADTSGDLISTQHLNRVLALDAAARTVIVEAGSQYGTLGAYLHRANFALPNLASLPHISVAGAVATATHGSGVRNQNLSASVVAMEIVTANGDVLECSRASSSDASHGNEFAGMVVALGAVGIVTQLTLEIVPAFDVKQTVYEHLPWATLRENFDDIMSCAYSISLFTTWREDTIEQVWLKQIIDDTLQTPRDVFGATPATETLHPVPGMSPQNCNDQLGIPGAWHERLPHFRIEFTPSAGKELQTEYFVARHDAPAAIAALERIRDIFSPLVLASEIRTIAADDLWLSPCYGRDSAALHFTWIQDWDAVRAVLPQMDAALQPFDARPHWGKLFTISPARLRELYPQFDAFRKLLAKYDPAQKFGNTFLEKYIFDA